MTENHQALSDRWVFRAVIAVIVSLLLLARIGYGQPQSVVETKQAVLQGSIQLKPVKPVSDDETDKIQPGTPVKIVVTVENKGSQTSAAGKLYVRYAFSKPLEREANSVIFETEKKQLPAIAPDQSVDIVFETPHTSPSLLDFVRDDWSMREYQAVAIFQKEEHVIGTLAITFSAYYYPGIKKEFPTKVYSGF